MSRVVRDYQVGGFPFRVRADAALLDRMENLAPFEIPGQARNDDEFLFTLEQGPDFARSGEPPVFCTEDGPECPEMAIFELAERYLFRVRPLPCRPVGAVVRLSQGAENVISRLSGAEVFDTLMSAAAAFRPFPPQAAGLHRTLRQLAETVPCYSFRGLPSVSAARLCCETLRAKP